MSFISKTKTLHRMFTNPRIFTGKVNYLFILSHMRSRSTLLSHIMGSNPQILGYSELGLTYRNQFDMLRFRNRLYKEFESSFQNKYLLDKLLHNEFSISNKIIERDNVKLIFLLRKPESTIQSIMKLGEIVNNRATELQVAVEYYCNRLNYLKNLREHLQLDFMFLESDDLISDPDGVLCDLTGWLNLEEPLSKNYSVFKNTGIAGHGDPSDNIHSGTIKTTIDYEPITIPDQILAKANSSYKECKNAFFYDENKFEAQ